MDYEPIQRASRYVGYVRGLDRALGVLGRSGLGQHPAADAILQLIIRATEDDASQPVDLRMSVNARVIDGGKP